jgi:hypothetical protein
MPLSVLVPFFSSDCLKDCPVWSGLFAGSISAYQASPDRVSEVVMIWFDTHRYEQ